jgi:hypothetical protein
MEDGAGRVLFLALIGVVLLSSFSFAAFFNSTLTQSKAYWNSTKPLSIADARQMIDGSIELELWNSGEEVLTLKGVNLTLARNESESKVTEMNYDIYPGIAQAVSIAGIRCSECGVVSYNLTFIYESAGGEVMQQGGEKSLSLRCTNPEGIIPCDKPFSSIVDICILLLGLVIGVYVIYHMRKGYWGESTVTYILDRFFPVVAALLVIVIVLALLQQQAF